MKTCHHRDRQPSSAASPQRTDERGNEVLDMREPLCRPGPGSAGGLTLPYANLRPPALVTELMAQGSLQQALARKAEIVASPLSRLLVAIEAAKVGRGNAPLGCCMHAWTLLPNAACPHTCMRACTDAVA